MQLVVVIDVLHVRCAIVVRVLGVCAHVRMHHGADAARSRPSGFKQGSSGNKPIANWLAGWLAGWLSWLAGWLAGWRAGWLAVAG